VIACARRRWGLGSNEPRWLCAAHTQRENRGISETPQATARRKNGH